MDDETGTIDISQQNPVDINQILIWQQWDQDRKGFKRANGTSTGIYTLIMTSYTQHVLLVGAIVVTFFVGLIALALLVAYILYRFTTLLDGMIKKRPRPVTGIIPRPARSYHPDYVSIDG